MKKCRKRHCPICRPVPPPTLSTVTATDRNRVASYVRRHWSFRIDGIYVDRGGWASRDNQGLGHIRNLLTTVNW